nr:myotubularin-related protein 3 isoform X2 [Anolis sagrei ordinatus]
MEEERVAAQQQQQQQANQTFPRKQLIREDDNLQVPFLELHGESTEFVGRAEEAVIALSNYRLHIKFKESLVNIPLQLIESVECRDIFQLHLVCKDCKIIRCHFCSLEQSQEWQRRLVMATGPPSRLEGLFSFAFHAWCTHVYASEKETHGELCRPGEHVTSRFKNEAERMGFDLNHAWRISNINEKYRLCSSYPQELIVPAWISDKELESVAGFRSWKRIPAVVYRHQSNGAVIARCGQPEVSWWGWRNADDEHLVQSVAKACASDARAKMADPGGGRGGGFSDGEFGSSIPHAPGAEGLAAQPQKLLILDARSYAAAVANRAKGGGCECPEYYPNCEVVFMGMANIHSIRKSFQSLRLLCSQVPDPGNWLSALESTKWLQHLSVLLKSALLVVHAVERDRRPVLVHCSDGWDRTPQIVALAKLLLDPYYRTIEGFQVLVETEWLDFGHKFADRCGHGEQADDPNERCPVFLQWLDCAHQLQRQFPCSFEFSEAFLVKLVQHTYSCLFGTFLCNNAKERDEKHTQERTCSVWSLLRPGNKAFQNLLYCSQSESVLFPVCHVRNLMLWSAVYLPGSSPSTPADDPCAPYPLPAPGPEEAPLGRLPKTRSFDNLTMACDSGSLPPTTPRRSSDPSLNEKWQEHRRTLEPSNHFGGEGDPYEGEAAGQGLVAEAELSLAVAEGQMENILQEATEEEEEEDNDDSEEVAGGKGGEADLQGTLGSPAEKVPDALDEELGIHSAGTSNTEGSTDTLTEMGARVKAPSASFSWLRPEDGNGEEALELHRLAATLNRTPPSAPSPCALPLCDYKEAVCNGEEAGEEGGWRRRRAKGALSRQMSGSGPRSLSHKASPSPNSPEQPAPRSHLDDDGMPAYADAIQQRLRQIESGHQQEVETLKKQLQELRSRLEGQLLNGSLHCNGMEYGDEVTSFPDLESNLDPSCLPRCSTELFSEASWEQVDKQDSEVTRWLPDHLAAHCYGCDSAFWLVSRKHHCRNCGNVFCSSCCNQKVPVPTQQLFEPSRVCKACYSGLGPDNKPVATHSN